MQIIILCRSEKSIISILESYTFHISTVIQTRLSWYLYLFIVIDFKCLRLYPIIITNIFIIKLSIKFVLLIFSKVLVPDDTFCWVITDNTENVPMNQPIKCRTLQFIINYNIYVPTLTGMKNFLYSPRFGRLDE